MSRRQRVTRPPTTPFHNLNVWLDQAADAINQLPPFSTSSTTNGPEGVIIADSGTYMLDVGSSATTFWAKLSGDTSTGWASVDVT